MNCYISKNFENICTLLQDHCSDCCYSQPAIACSTLTTETLEKGVKYDQS